jgi:hypothetical protein
MDATDTLGPKSQATENWFGGLGVRLHRAAGACLPDVGLRRDISVWV